MRLRHFLLASAFVAATSQAQDEVPQSRPSLDAALPDEVRAALIGMTKVETLFPVDGSEPFAGTVLKADVVSFSPGSELVLQNVSAPYIVIAARDVKFPDATSSYRIRFVDAPAADGVDGPDGARGANGQGEQNFNGRPGAAGATGQPGGTGTTHALPHVYFIVDHFSVANDPKPRSINLSLKLRGVTGGDGGRGGAGGDGGDGAEGKKGSDGVFDCKHGGGDGGRGGDGGSGGPGGGGGQGGDGAALTFVSTSLGVSQFGYASILNQGGSGGGNGAGGRAGRPGYGGPGGHGSVHCGGGHGGSAGTRRAPGADGPDGARGQKGVVELISVPSVPIV
ncbi:hypothetical protein [Sphingomonas ginsenosidivorax]|uniref:hypothetical protein n=1 Tax=Sphingomonas ginsenosidivorax TaxID=862135 RepID=UPI0013151A05|nr:hypothetical protein [Sphingomonas ginsenosidivorax]